MSAIGDLVQIVGAGLELGHGAEEQTLLALVEAEARGDEAGQALVVGLAKIMAVEALELLEIEARRRFPDVVEVEPFNRLVAADDFVVAVAPAEPEQIV